MAQLSEEIAAEVLKWLEGAAKKCTLVELRGSMAPESLLQPWELAEEGHPTILEEIADLCTRETGGGPERAFYLLAFRKPGDARHERRYVLRCGAGKRTEGEDGGKGLLSEARGVIRDQHQALADANRLLLDMTRSVCEASTRQMGEQTKQLAAYQSDQWRVYEMMREMSKVDREGERETLEAKKDFERTRVGGELLSMLAPALMAKIRPGSVAGSQMTGDMAVVALLRTLTQEQQDKLTQSNVLSLTTEQMTAALTLVSEIKGANGAVESPLLRELARWLASLDETQTQALAMGEVSLTQSQVAAFLELYMRAGEYSAARDSKANGREARPS
jgi:hypothetical protein